MGGRPAPSACLLLYREDLENPPLLVVSDLDRFEIHTNFTAKPTVVYAFSLDELAEPKNLDILRKLFTDPRALEPGEDHRGDHPGRDSVPRFAEQNAGSPLWEYSAAGSEREQPH